MRKIKITALLLAVLMIVTAFAGCASKSTVTNLDNKVNDLDASIEEQKAALSGIESTLATISKALENQGSSDNLDEVIKDIEENEKNVADIAGALKDLQAAIEDLKKEPATQAPAVSGDVVTAINQYSAKLEALAGKIEDDKANYTAETLTAIRELVGETETVIENAADKAAAEAAYKAFEDKLADKALMSVNGQLYAYVLELKGNITDASADKVDEAVAALEAAKKFYKDGAAAKALTEYEVNDDETIDLVAAINALEDAQYIELPIVKAEAQNIDAAIAKIDASYDFKAVTEILTDYKAWEKDAKALSPENVKLVKNYDALLKAHTSALNSDVAKTIFAAGKIESVLFDTFGDDVAVFADYVALLADGDNAQVLYVFDTEKLLADGTKAPTKALTSKIYAAIDAWVADWAKEYGLTDLAVEAIIDAWAEAAGLGDDFYAKYNADKALVAAFEAEAKTLTDGIFANIKALNNKRLGADAKAVLDAYQKNATDINEWKKALVNAYKAELLADEDSLYTRNVNTYALYEEALEANFNAVVVEAKLCKYNADTKTYATYGLGFNEKAADNEYYHKLYDFQDANMEQFLLVTYKEAKAVADKINARIENFKTAQAHSIIPLVANIGGYVVPNAAGNKLVAREEIDIRDDALGTPDTIAEFVYKYKTTAKYDLSGMLKVADYEAKIAAVEKNIKAADAALAAIDTAYGKYLETDGIVTMADYAQITALKGLLESWMKVGHVEMAIATEAGTTNGVKEYKVIDLLDRYSNVNAKLLDDTAVSSMTADLSKYSPIMVAHYQVTQLKKEADFAVTAYQMMDKIWNAFSNSNSMAFGFDNHVLTNVPDGVISGTRTHFASNGVVACTVSDPMTADGVDIKGRAYKQNQSFWTVEYVVADSAKFTTKKLEGYYYSNYSDLASATNGTSNVRADLAAKLPEALKMLFIKKDDNGAYEKDDKTGAYVKLDKGGMLDSYIKLLFETIPDNIQKNNVGDLKSKALYNGSALPNFVLPIMAMTLEGKFMVDNYNEEYTALTNAKKNWDPENGGYGFTYVKALTYAYIDNVDAKVDGKTGSMNKTAINKSTDIESLRIAAKACLVEAKETVEEIVFGGADASWMHQLYKVDAATLAAAGIEDADLIVPGLVIYKECDHETLANETCEGKTVKCDECAELIAGKAKHKAPQNAFACNGYNCEVCGTPVPAKHTYTAASFKVEQIYVTTVGQLDTGIIAISYTCDECGEPCAENIMIQTYTFTDNADGVISTGDSVEFVVTIEGTDYTVTAEYDATTQAWINTATLI